MKYKSRTLDTAEVATFDELVAIGIDQATTLHNGMPWSFFYRDQHVTHESDDCYIVGGEKFQRGQLLVTSDDPAFATPVAWWPDEFHKDYEPLECERTKLLKEAADWMGSNEASPTEDWWKRYFLHADKSAHMVLTDEGWAPAACYFDTPEEDRPELLDEVNAPIGKELIKP